MSASQLEARIKQEQIVQGAQSEIDSEDSTRDFKL